ncbi:MltA-interacting MipA family protein, partial [Thermodesulfobacteriota bacterium]
VVQPSVDVSHKGFGINVWGNIDIDDYNDTLKSGEFSEVDFALSDGFNIKSVDVSVGYIEYLFPNGGEGTRELFGTLGYNILIY